MRKIDSCRLVNEDNLKGKLTEIEKRERTKENDITPRTAGSKRSMQLRGLS